MPTAQAKSMKMQKLMKTIGKPKKPKKPKITGKWSRGEGEGVFSRNLWFFWFFWNFQPTVQ